MLFHYRAANESGQITEADIEAETQDRVLEYLAGKSLRPLSVERAKAGEALRLFSGKITLTDKIFITRYLALMLQAGTDLLTALNVLIEDFEKPAVKNFLVDVRERVSKGQPLYYAFASRPKSFSPIFINLLKAAETSGNLEQTFVDLSEFQEREGELRGRLKAALTYPLILLAVSLLVFVFLVTFALPRIARVFTEAGVNPPAFSKVVFTIGLFAGEHLFLILGALAAVIALSIYFFGHTLPGRRLGRRILVRTPFVRKVYQGIAIQRFASTFSVLLRAGIPVIESLKITGDVVGNDEIRAALIRIADEGLAEGLTVGDAFRREAAFPRVVTNLVAVSESAGHLDEVLGTLARFYESSVDAEVKSLVAILEPLLLLFMGGLVGLVAISIIIPIYQLTSQF